MIAPSTGALQARLNLFRPLAGIRGIELETHVPEHLPMKADPDLVLVVIDTLVSLSIKKGCAGERVVITVRQIFHDTSTLGILLQCTGRAPTAQEVDEDVEIIRPLCQQLKIGIQVLNPSAATLLFQLEI